MVFGDNVRARKAARALPRTPTGKEEENQDKTPHTTHTTTPPLFYHTQTITAIPQ